MTAEYFTRRPAIPRMSNPAPMAHLGFAGSRHMVPDRLPAASWNRAVGLRVIDLNPDTIRNIQELTGTLRRLDLSNLQLSTLSPEIVEGLNILEKLDLSHNLLNEESFPPNFKDLDSIIEICVHDNKLEALPKVMRKLKNLHRLKLSQNVLSKLEGLEKLKRLLILILDDNNLESLPKEVLTNLKKLEILHCAGNRLTTVPSEIRNMRHLRDLNLSGNKLTYLPSEIFLLPRIEVINASGNDISRIPTVNVKSHKQKLVSIDLSDNLLVRFPAHLLFKTQKLDLTRNKIKNIPLTLIDKLDQVMDLDLRLNENPMTVPPQEVADCGLPSIIQYFMDIRTNMKVYQGLKVMVLGASDQGKTSLIQSLLDQQARLTEDEPTSGLDIYDYTIDLDKEDPLGKNLNLSLWDHSGNPRYLFQHLFFLQNSSLILLVFNLAEYNKTNFRSLIGCWIDWVIAKTNKIIALPVGTHADKIPKKKLKEVLDQVSSDISDYINEIRGSIEKEIRRIESKSYISPALSEQLQIYVGLAKLETVIYQEVIPVSSKKFTGMSELEAAITNMAQNTDIFPNVLRPIPSLWAEVENYIDDRGYAMQIPLLKWDEYEHLITSKFGMRHLMVHITSYLHDTGKIVWFQDHPTLKDFVFLRPAWLTDVLKTVFRHDISDIDYNTEESFRQYGISPMKLDKMKKDLNEEAIIERDLLRCLWSNIFMTDTTQSVLEVLAVLLEHFQIGYGLPSKLKRRASGVSRAGSGDRVENSRLDSAGTTRSSSRLDSAVGKRPDSRLDTASTITSRSKTTDKPEPSSPPKVSRVFIPWLKDNKPYKNFKDEYQKHISNPCVVAVFRFPKYIPPGLFEVITVRAQKHEFELTTIGHWKNGLYSRHVEQKVRMFLQKIDHDDGGTCVRVEVRHESTDDQKDGSPERGSVAGYALGEEEQEQEIEQLWKLLLPFLKDTEELISKCLGIRMERYMECPKCHSLSFLGEWRTPKDLQGLPTKPCEMCKEDIPTEFLVQPKEKRRVEEFLLQKLLKEAERRRQDAAEREKAASLSPPDATSAGDVSAAASDVSEPSSGRATPKRNKHDRKKGSNGHSNNKDGSKSSDRGSSGGRRSAHFADQTTDATSGGDGRRRSSSFGSSGLNKAHLSTLKEET